MDTTAKRERTLDEIIKLKEMLESKLLFGVIDRNTDLFIKAQLQAWQHHMRTLGPREVFVPKAVGFEFHNDGILFLDPYWEPEDYRAMQGHGKPTSSPEYRQAFQQAPH